MASTTRLLDRATLTEGDRITPTDAPDLGDGSTLEIVVVVHEATEGESPTLTLTHAPTAEEDAWMDFPTPVRVSLARTGRTWVHVPCFTRYVGWAISGTLEGSPVVTIDLVAKP